MSTIAEVIVAKARDLGVTGDATTVTGAIDLLVDQIAGSDVGEHETIADAMADLLSRVSKTPSGTKSVTANGANVDVSSYAKVDVAVPAYVVAYDANGGTGSVAPVACAKGSTVTLSDGTGLTAPSEKEFAGWATDAAAEEPDVTSPYAATADATLYAVWAAVESPESTD